MKSFKQFNESRDPADDDGIKNRPGQSADSQRQDQLRAAHHSVNRKLGIKKPAAPKDTRNSEQIMQDARDKLKARMAHDDAWRKQHGSAVRRSEK